MDIYAIARLDGGNHLQSTRHSAWKEMKCPAAFLHTHRWEQIFYKTVVFTDRLDIYVIVPLLDGADSLDNNFGRVWLLRHLIKTRLVWVQVREGWVLHEKLSWKVKTNTLSKIRKDGRNACTSEAKRGGQHHIGMHVNAYMWGFYYLYSCSVPPSTIDLTVMEYFTRIPSFILLASVSHIS